MKDKISINELKELFPGSNSINDICNHGDINRFSLWKPTSCYTDIKKLELNNIKEAGCSLTLKPIPDLLISINGYYESLSFAPSHFEDLDYNWEYKRPEGGETDPLRIGDLRYYNPNAKPPLLDTGTVVISRKTLEDITQTSRINIPMLSRFSDMTWGYKGNNDSNMTPLNYIIPDITNYKLGVAVFIPETEKWELFVSDYLDEYPEDSDALHNPDGTLQDKQYLNRLPKFASNIPAVELILNSASKEFTYIPCLVKNYTNNIKSASIYSFPLSKPSKMKIEDYIFDQGVANDCPDKYLDQFPNKWFAALVYMRDENGLISKTDYNGDKYYLRKLYILNQSNPKYLPGCFIDWSISWKTETTGKYWEGSWTTREGTFDSTKDWEEIEINGNKYYGEAATVEYYISDANYHDKFTYDQDYFYNYIE